MPNACMPRLFEVRHTTLTMSDNCVRHLCRSSLLLWERSESQIRLNNSEVREEGLGLLVLNTGVDNDIVTGYPVDGGCDTAAKSVS